MLDAAPAIILPPEKPALVRASDLRGLPSWQEMQRRVRGERTAMLMPVFVPSGDAAPSIPANTKLLLHPNGTNGSTTITDASAAAHGNATLTGSTQISSAIATLDGSTSILFDGSGDYLSYAYHADWDFGTGDFTVEFRVYFSALQRCGLLHHYDGAGLGPGWALSYVHSGTILRWFKGDGTNIDRTWAPTTGTWYAVRVIRTGTTLRMFVNGVQLGADGTDSTTLSNGSANLQIGREHFGTNDLAGRLQEVLIVKGTALDGGAAYTPPTKQYV